MLVTVPHRRDDEVRRSAGTTRDASAHRNGADRRRAGAPGGLRLAHRRSRIVTCLMTLLLLTACGDEDTGGGPAGGFDDRAPEAPGSDDADDRTTSSIDDGDRIEGTDTEAGTPSGGIGNVEGEGDVNDLGEEDG